MTALHRVDEIGANVLDASADELAAGALALARRFAAGATLWCASPEAPHHARHVAVEFVHPVIVGKRSLPAVALAGPDPATAARGLVRPGDVVMAVGSPRDPSLARLLRRGRPWGITTIHLVVGGNHDLTLRPEQVAGADHAVWIDTPDRTSTLLGYHLLWELTHIALEHPGLLTAAASGAYDDDMCLTCSDEGRLVEVIHAVDGRTARVRDDGGEVDVDTSLVGAVSAGDLLLTHAGVALQVVEQEGRP